MVLAQQTVIIDCLLDWRSSFFPLLLLLLSLGRIVAAVVAWIGFLSVSFHFAMPMAASARNEIAKSHITRKQTKKDTVLCQTLTDRSV